MDTPKTVLSNLIALAEPHFSDPAQLQALEQAKELRDHIEDPVFVLRIEQRNGATITLHRTEAGAMSVLVDYCRERWIKEAPTGEEAPDSDDELIDAYFDLPHHNEDYEIEEIEIE